MATPKPDEAHRLTDAELAKLERRVARVYQEARDDLQKTVDDYFERFRERDTEMKALIGTVQNGREWTVNDYKQWRLNQIARGKRFEALRDKMAERYTRANETAMSYVNDKTPGIYSLNRNYSAYVIDKATGGALTLDGGTVNADFILFDEQTVKRLIVEDPDVMPYYQPERAVQRGIDLAYGKSQITKNVTSGILRGLSIKEMADGLQERIQTMERTSAIRAARTAVTAAQNAGRMDSYRAAQDMGIKLKKRWLATLDARTRHSHRMLDGETRETDEAFSNGCIYPGDPRGAPHETYNCRCTLIASLPDFDLSPGKRRAKGETADAEDKSSVVIEDMTYSEWAGWVKKNGKAHESKQVLENQSRASFVQTQQSAYYRDITSAWYPDSVPNSHEVRDLQSYTVDGITYNVDQRNVVLDYKPNEREIAELLEKEIGGEIYMVPRVNNPPGISTPDFLFHGNPYDLKTITGSGKNTLYNAVSKKKRQSPNFIFETSGTTLTIEEIVEQVSRLYTSKHTAFINEIVIVRNKKIVRVFSRKV